MEQRRTSSQTINNEFYHALKESWLNDERHPIALLRAENRLRIPWILEILEKRHFPQKVLDIGCGAGFLTNALALKHEVTGIDLSESSLSIARQTAPSKRVNYLLADAENLPFENEQFDIVSALDLLEHVENPKRVIEEASRVLKPGGLFFFHTFNRNLLSYLLIIKGVDWLVPNAPKNMHLLRLFIKPDELTEFCKDSYLTVQEIRGMRPSFNLKNFYTLLVKRKIDETFRFQFTPSLLTGYCGVASKSDVFGDRT